MSAPWRSDTAELLRTTIGVVTTAAVHDRAGALVARLEVQELRIGWDAARAPRCVLALTTRVPLQQPVLDALDPRTGSRVRVRAGYVRPDGVTDVHDFVDLGVRTRAVDRPTNLVQLSAAGDEALVLDADPGAGLNPPQESLSAAVRGLVAVGTGAPPQWENRLGSVAPLTGVVIGEGEELWAVIDTALDGRDADLHDDGLRRWVLEPRPVLTAPSYALVVGARGTIETSSTSLSREDWHNAVQLRFEWETDEGDGLVRKHRVIGTAAVTSGPYAAAPGNRRSFRELRQLAVDQAGADAAAAAVLARRVAAGRSITLTAVAALWVRPGQSVLVSLPTGPSAVYLVRAVEFDLPAARMSLVLTRPDDTVTIDTGA